LTRKTDVQFLIFTLYFVRRKLNTVFDDNGWRNYRIEVTSVAPKNHLLPSRLMLWLSKIKRLKSKTNQKLKIAFLAFAVTWNYLLNHSTRNWHNHSKIFFWGGSRV
jgi:hypothetical protein